MAQLKLPIGIENFKKIRTEGYYYVDKTDVIRQIFRRWLFRYIIGHAHVALKIIEYEHASNIFWG